MMPKFSCLVGLIVGSAAGASGILHSPLDGLRGPLMMSFQFLNMFTLCLKKQSTQPSSHSCPTEMRVPGFRLL